LGGATMKHHQSPIKQPAENKEDWHELRPGIMSTSAMFTAGPKLYMLRSI